jgi:malonyl-CoA/methylmalonyl-CoA synthetase
MQPSSSQSALSLARRLVAKSISGTLRGGGERGGVLLTTTTSARSTTTSSGKDGDRWGSRRRRKRSQTSVCSTFTTATTTADDDNDILSLLCHTALANPNRPAIASGIHSKGPLDAVTYAKLFNFSHTLARSKVLRDVEIGERVGIYCAPNAEFVASVYAIWMRGAVAVPVSAFGDEADRAHVARDSGMKTCLVPPRRNDEFFRRSGDVKEEEFTCGEAEIRRVHKIPKWALKPCDFQKGWLEDVHQKSDESVGALILYTSGTTGQPKGVLHTRQSLYSQAKTLSDAWEISKKDRLLHCLPLHHVHGLVNGVLASHASGATVEFTDSFKFDPRYFWRRMRNSGPQITMFYGVPTMYAMALRQLDVYDNADRRRREKEEEDRKSVERKEKVSTRSECAEEAKALRLCVSGSAACPPSILDQWNRLTGNQSPLLERYGMTEIGMALSQKLDFSSRAPGSVGEPLANSECKILDDATNELLVKGPGIFKEYWNNPKATEEAFTSDGYFKTGDVVSVSADKKDWRIVGRASVDVLKVGGEKVSALEIEARVLEGLGKTSLKEIAVFGEADENYGERAVAIVAPTDEYKSLENFSDKSFDDEVKAWTRENLTSERWITKTYVVDSIPRNAMGKVNKKSLKATFSSS